MAISVWIIWIILAGVLLVAELFTGTVAALCLSVGCLGASIASAFTPSLTWQIIVFAICTVLAFIFIRPAIKHLGLRPHGAEYRTNMDALIGRTGKVTHDITNNSDDNGRVQVYGDSWLAYTTESDWPIARGEQVVVEAYESCVLRVRRWRDEDGRK